MTHAAFYHSGPMLELEESPKTGHVRASGCEAELPAIGGAGPHRSQPFPRPDCGGDAKRDESPRPGRLRQSSGHAWPPDLRHLDTVSAFGKRLRRGFSGGPVSWRVELEGDEEVVEKLERMLIAHRWTFSHRGFSSTNDTHGHCLPPTKDELRFFEDMETRVAEIEIIYNPLDVLGDAINNSSLTQKAKDLIMVLVSHLESRGCLEDR